MTLTGARTYQSMLGYSALGLSFDFFFLIPELLQLEVYSCSKLSFSHWLGARPLHAQRPSCSSWMTTIFDYEYPL